MTTTQDGKSTIKLPRPKYDEAVSPPLVECLENELAILSFAKVRGDSQTMVGILDLLLSELMVSVLQDFCKLGITNPSVGQLKTTLGGVETKTIGEWDSELRSMRYDKTKWVSLQAYYDKILNLARLSLGEESKTTSRAALESFCLSIFAIAMS